MLIIRRLKLHYTASGIITPIVTVAGVCEHRNEFGVTEKGAFSIIGN